MARVPHCSTVVLMGEHLIRKTNAAHTVRAAATTVDARLQWQAPQWWLIEAGSAEDNVASGADSVGRLS
jgi:hypothetical protein